MIETKNRYDYASNEQASHELRDEYLIPFYERYSHQGRYVFLDGGGALKTELQSERKIDTLMQTRDGMVAIDEKMDRPKDHERSNFALSTESSSVTNRPSIMRVSQADVLLYCFLHRDSTMTAYWIPMRSLIEWFWLNVDDFPVWINRKKNMERCSLVPKRRLVREVRGVKAFYLPE